MAKQNEIIQVSAVAVGDTETVVIPWTAVGVNCVVWFNNIAASDAVATVTVYGAPEADGTGAVAIDAATIAAVAADTTERAVFTTPIPYVRVTAQCGASDAASVNAWITRQAYESSSA